MFSNTLDGDYNNSPSDAQSASNAWSASSSTVTDTEADNDAGLPATPVTDTVYGHSTIAVGQPYLYTDRSGRTKFCFWL